MSVEAVVVTLERASVRYALIGAMAVAARGVARATLDIDFMTADARVLDAAFWQLAVEIRRGDYDDPLRGVVRIQSDRPIDVVVAKYKWQAEIIDRAQRADYLGLNVPIPSASDLILLKLAAGGPRDMYDAVALLATDRERLVNEVDAKIGSVTPDVTAEWNSIRQERR